MQYNIRMKNTKVKNYIVLHLLFALVSLSSVCSKFASGCEFLSLKYCFWQCGMIGFLGLYAIGWQQIIKRMPLGAAYVNKAATVLWGLIWGLLIFRESLTPGKIIGAVIVAAGVVLFALADNEIPEVGDE